MDEVLKIKKELEKILPQKDAKGTLDLLKCLDSIPMSLEVLQKTHIGMTVNKTRKALDNQDIYTLCKSMVKRWKKLLDKVPSNSGDTSSSNYNNGQKHLSSNQSPPEQRQEPTQQSQQPQQQHPASKTEINDEQQSGQLPPPPASSEKKTYSKSAPIQSEAPPTNSEVRLKVRQLLCDALRKPLPKELSNESFLDEEVLSGRIEEAIYQEFKDTGVKYKNRFRSRVSNLGDVKNPYLRLNVLRGDIAPERIAKMTAEEMASDELKKQREKFTKEAINDHQMAVTSGTKTSEIKCPACKKFNVTYNQVQTRSADEPMTTFCFCNECGKRWKFC